MEKISFKEGTKPSWADINAHLDIILNDEVIGNIGLLSVKAMNDSKIKRTNVAIFEINVDKLIPYPSRTNEFKHIPVLPSIE